MWIVILVRAPKISDFRAGYFPRRQRYKRDAEKLAREIVSKGGEARVERVPPERRRK